MIRRGFWLAVGATGGIIGYRRVAALGRRLSGTLMLAPGAEPDRPGTPAALGAPGTPAALGTRGALRAAGAQPRSARRERQAGRGLARGAIRLTRDVRRFNRDVREGMDLYLARHPGQRSPTLGPGPDNDERVKDDR